MSAHQKQYGGQWLAVAFITVVLAFPRTFLELKLLILACITVQLASILIAEKRLHISKRILIFYGSIIAMGIVWSLIGLVQANPTQAIQQAIRLYVFWSLLIPVVIIYTRYFDPLMVIHRGVLCAGLLTATITLSFIASRYIGISLFPTWFEEAMLLRVGFHDGYVQVVSHNIGMLLFVVPYLFITLLHTDSRSEHRILVIAIFVLTLITAFLSGRRALWLSIAMMPYIMLGFCLITGRMSHIKSSKIVIPFLLILPFFAITAPLLLLQEDTLLYLTSAFSEEDERSIQATFLINGFLDNFFWGTGFGGNAGYLRSDISPWLYEMTYHQVLFNFGLVGAVLFVTLALYMFYGTFQKMMSDPGRTQGALPILCGISGVLIGSYSNPYLGSFDYLIVLGFLPLLAGLPNAPPTTLIMPYRSYT